MRKILSIVASLFAIFACAPACADDFADLATRCAPEIHVKTLAAVVWQESAGNPFSININRAAALRHQPESASEAVLTARRLLAEGFNIDVGLGQVNSANFTAGELERLFTPCGNLQAAARILSGCYARAVAVQGEGQAALRAALSCYNTGSFTAGIRNGYVRKVSAKAGLFVPELLPASSGTSQTIRSAPPPRAGGEPDVFAAGDADAFAGESGAVRDIDQK
jgi:type IV secretion system protein VirB1